MDPSDTSQIQTFGIELELICLRPEVLPDGISPENPDCDNILDAVYDGLVRNGVPVSDHNSFCINDGLPPFSQWRVEEEVLSLTPAEEALLPSGYIIEPLELASRKFYYGHEDWRSEILAVLNALKDLESHGVKFITNQSTGFHVHVGYDNRIVPVRTAKNVFLLATAFEHILDELHAAPRMAIPWEKEERHHCYPLSFFATKRGHGNELFERLQFIERISTYEQMGSVFFISADEMGTDEQCTGHNSAYNFDNLFPDEENGRYAETLTGTIEFRQHAGTLDYSAIVGWIELTTGILRFAEKSAEDLGEMVNLLDLLLEATNPDAERRNMLFSDVGIADMPDEVYEYYGMLRGGTLALPAPEVTDKHVPLVPLLSSNWAATVADNSRQAVLAIIKDKYARGTYGHDPTFVPFGLPDLTGSELLSRKQVESAAVGVISWDGQELSQALQWVFGKLSEQHQEVINEVFAERQR